MSVVVLSPDEVRELIHGAVRAALAGRTDAPELMTTAQVAEELGVSHDLVRLWVREQGCPHLRVGAKKLRFRKGDVVKWLERKDA